jgi:hypothetical protein
MNPHASSKCARRLFMALAAIAGIMFLAGCGSSNSNSGNTQGFGVANLSGTYVFSSTGLDGNGDYLAYAGAFTADGKGNISAGSMDVVDPDVSLIENASVTGSYSINTDGRGQANLNTSSGDFTIAFVLAATTGGIATHGLVIEYDTNGSGSGTLDLQTSLTGVSQLAASYAYSLAGVDSNLQLLASDGAFALTSGSITNGIADFNDAASTLYTGQSIQPGTSITLGSGTGPGTLTITTASFALAFDVFPIDPTHIKLIETDYAEFLAGDAFSQTGTTIPQGNMVFAMEGGGISDPIATGGLMAADGSGSFNSGLEDDNIAGVFSPAQIPFTGAGSVGTLGRDDVTLTGFTPAAKWIAYPITNGVLLLEMDTAGITQGLALPQSATAISAGTSVGYGLNLTGFNENGDGGAEEVDTIAQFDATTASTNNMTGTLNENDEGSIPGPSALTGTYTPDATADGRGQIVATANNTDIGGLTLWYYVADSSTALFIEQDQAQVSAGTFQLQGSSSTSVAQAHANISLVRLRPGAKAGKNRQKK